MIELQGLCASGVPPRQNIGTSSGVVATLLLRLHIAKAESTSLRAQLTQDVAKWREVGHSDTCAIDTFSADDDELGLCDCGADEENAARTKARSSVGLEE